MNLGNWVINEHRSPPWNQGSIFKWFTFKAGTHRPNRWTYEVLGETRTRSRTNMFVQVRRKLSELRGRCLLRFSMRSLRRWAVGRVSHWILWLVVCQLNGRCGGVRANQRDVWEGWNTVCALVFYAPRSVIPRFHVLQYWHETSSYVRSGRINLCSFGNASLLQLPTQAPPAYCISRKRRMYTLLCSRQYVKAVCFNATFLWNGSDKRQQSGRKRQPNVWAVCGGLQSQSLKINQIVNIMKISVIR